MCSFSSLISSIDSRLYRVRMIVSHVSYGSVSFETSLLQRKMHAESIEQVWFMQNKLPTARTLRRDFMMNSNICEH